MSVKSKAVKFLVCDDCEREGATRQTAQEAVEVSRARGWLVTKDTHLCGVCREKRDYPKQEPEAPSASSRDNDRSYWDSETDFEFNQFLSGC